MTIELKNEDRLRAENARLRSALHRCANKLEKCAILSGSDPELAAIAVKEFRDLTETR